MRPNNNNNNTESGDGTAIHTEVTTDTGIVAGIVILGTTIFVTVLLVVNINQILFYLCVYNIIF